MSAATEHKSLRRRNLSNTKTEMSLTVSKFLCIDQLWGSSIYQRLNWDDKFFFIKSNCAWITPKISDFLWHGFHIYFITRLDYYYVTARLDWLLWWLRLRFEIRVFTFTFYFLLFTFYFLHFTFYFLLFTAINK